MILRLCECESIWIVDWCIVRLLCATLAIRVIVLDPIVLFLTWKLTEVTNDYKLVGELKFSWAFFILIYKTACTSTTHKSWKNLYINAIHIVTISSILNLKPIIHQNTTLTKIISQIILLSFFFSYLFFFL